MKSLTDLLNINKNTMLEYKDSKVFFFGVCNFVFYFDESETKSKSMNRYFQLYFDIFNKQPHNCDWSIEACLVDQ